MDTFQINMAATKFWTEKSVQDAFKMIMRQEVTTKLNDFDLQHPPFGIA